MDPPHSSSRKPPLPATEGVVRPRTTRENLYDCTGKEIPFRIVGIHDSENPLPPQSEVYASHSSKNNPSQPGTAIPKVDGKTVDAKECTYPPRYNLLHPCVSRGLTQTPTQLLTTLNSRMATSSVTFGNIVSYYTLVERHPTDLERTTLIVGALRGRLQLRKATFVLRRTVRGNSSTRLITHRGKIRGTTRRIVTHYESPFTRSESRMHPVECIRTILVSIIWASVG